MNNKQLNKEYTQMMKERNKFKKTGFTDSEDEDYDEATNKSLKSPKSGRSTLSEKSSLLSARSPRISEDNLLITPKRKMFNTIKHQEPRKVSPNSEDEHTYSSARKTSSRFSHHDSKLSPKSPRNSDHIDSFPKFDQRQHYQDEDRITPRSSRSVSEREDFDNLNMLSTMKKPLNDNLALNKTLRRTDAFDASRSQKIRAGTPTKLIFSQNKDQQPVPHSRAVRPKDEDIFEEESHRSSRSARSTPTSSVTHFNQRRSSKGSQSPKGYSSSPPQHISPRSNRSISSNRPDSLVENENQEAVNYSLVEKNELDKEKQAYINHAKSVDILLNPNTEVLIQKKKKTEEKIQKVEKDFTNRKIAYENPEKDPHVTESIEDSKVIEKLNKEREAKRIEREKRARTQTISTKKIEEAIEKLENESEDKIRANKLKELNKELNYSTKPIFNETKLFSDIRSRPNRTHSARQTRNRSSSESGRFDRILGSKYANVKPKIQTRLPAQSARLDDDFVESSKLSIKQDVLNDSSSIRQNIYNEWYKKKMAQAVEQLKEAQNQQKNDEELKAQDLIEKLKKSKLEYDKWCERKEVYFNNRKEKLLAEKKAKEDEEERKKEKKSNGSKAFDEWLKIIAEREKETKSSIKEKQIETEKQNRKRKEKKIEKPPLPFEAWAKKKESQIQEKLISVKEKQSKKEIEEKEKLERKKLAEKSYNEWLDKKEKEEDIKELSKSLSSSMSALPPFYPSSKTIPFGR